MKKRSWLAAVALLVSVTSGASGQVVSGLMTVTGAEMH